MERGGGGVHKKYMGFIRSDIEKNIISNPHEIYYGDGQIESFLIIEENMKRKTNYR